MCVCERVWGDLMAPFCWMHDGMNRANPSPPKRAAVYNCIDRQRNISLGLALKRKGGGGGRQLVVGGCSQSGGQILLDCTTQRAARVSAIIEYREMTPTGK